MILDTLRAAIKAGREAREAGRREAIRAEVAAYLSKLPEKQVNKIVSSVLAGSDLTDAMLRRFVATCPPDKHIEVSFPSGGSLVVSGRADEARGPGW